MLLDKDRVQMGHISDRKSPIDLLKALGTVEKQLRLARSEILSLNKRLKMLERRTQNIEQWKGEQK